MLEKSWKLPLLIDITIVILLFLHGIALELNWVYIIIYIPILLYEIIGLSYISKNIPLLLKIGVFCGRILPFIVIFFNLEIIYGFMGMFLFEFMSFFYSRHYPLMFLAFPLEIGKKLNQNSILINNLVKKKQYCDAYKQLENQCSYILGQMENEKLKPYLENLNDIFIYFVNIIPSLISTFSRIGRKDYAQLLFENYKKLMIKYFGIIDKIFGEDDESRTSRKLVLLWDMIACQIGMGNKVEALKLLSDYNKELDVFEDLYPEGRISMFKNPLIQYINIYLKDSSVSREKVKLLENAVKSCEPTSAIIKSLGNIAMFNIYSFEAARLAIYEGLIMMKDIKISEAKSSFEKAELLIKSTKKSWIKNSSIENSGKIYLNIAESLNKILECRSDPNLYIEAKNLLVSTAKFTDDVEMLRLFDQIIYNFDKSIQISSFDNEYKNISEFINKDMMSILTILLDNIIQGGYLSDKLIFTVRPSTGLNKEFISQGLGIILMVVSILAQQNLLVLLLSFLVGIFLIGIGRHFEFIKNIFQELKIDNWLN